MKNAWLTDPTILYLWLKWCALIFKHRIIVPSIFSPNVSSLKHCGFTTRLIETIDRHGSGVCEHVTVCGQGSFPVCWEAVEWGGRTDEEP